MSVVEALMDAAVADTDVLRSLDSNGDRFSVFRDVDFLLRAPTKEKADLVASFINDHSYGAARVQEDLSVLVVIRMPVEQPIAMCVSGFFTCLSKIFGVDYDGWGCVAQRQT
jgi:hypothetical protein